MFTRKRHWLALIFLAFWTVQPGSPLAPRLEAAEPAGCAWAGIYPTVITPFRDCSGGIDRRSLELQLARALQGGVHGLLVLGTLGEGQYVTMEEREEVIAIAVRMACARVPVVVGVHTCDLETARIQVLQARRLGARAVLVKYLGRPHASLEVVCGFYAELSALNILPIFYYHFPAQTELDFPPRALVRILALPGVVGIKESILDLREIKRHIRLCRGMDKVFFTSTALNLTQFLEIGGQGAMCPEAVLLPEPTVRAYEAYTNGRPEEARALQGELFQVAPILRLKPIHPTLMRVLMMTAEDLKIGIPMSQDQPQAQMKAALNYLGVPTHPWVKCPLPQLTADDDACVQATVCRLRAIDWCEVGREAPAVPWPTQATVGGALLKTGAFQLGPGVGRDLLHSQGDGQGGFLFE